MDRVLNSATSFQDSGKFQTTTTITRIVWKIRRKKNTRRVLQLLHLCECVFVRDGFVSWIFPTPLWVPLLPPPWGVRTERHDFFSHRPPWVSVRGHRENKNVVGQINKTHSDQNRHSSRTRVASQEQLSLWIKCSTDLKYFEEYKKWFAARHNFGLNSVQWSSKPIWIFNG